MGVSKELGAFNFKIMLGVRASGKEIKDVV
jgi:hypothetical protein